MPNLEIKINKFCGDNIYKFHMTGLASTATGITLFALGTGTAALITAIALTAIGLFCLGFCIGFHDNNHEKSAHGYRLKSQVFVIEAIAVAVMGYLHSTIPTILGLSFCGGVFCGAQIANLYCQRV